MTELSNTILSNIMTSFADNDLAQQMQDEWAGTRIDTRKRFGEQFDWMLTGVFPLAVYCVRRDEIRQAMAALDPARIGNGRLIIKKMLYWLLTERALPMIPPEPQFDEARSVVKQVIDLLDRELNQRIQPQSAWKKLYRATNPKETYRMSGVISEWRQWSALPKNERKRRLAAHDALAMAMNVTVSFGGGSPTRDENIGPRLVVSSGSPEWPQSNIVGEEREAMLREVVNYWVRNSDKMLELLTGPEGEIPQ